MAASKSSFMWPYGHMKFDLHISAHTCKYMSQCKLTFTVLDNATYDLLKIHAIYGKACFYGNI